MAEKETKGVYSAKAMLLKHGEQGTKIRYTDRKKVEIIKATKHYSVGQVINPHVIKADELIDLKIAKEVK